MIFNVGVAVPSKWWRRHSMRVALRSANSSESAGLPNGSKMRPMSSMQRVHKERKFDETLSEKTKKRVQQLRSPRTSVASYLSPSVPCSRYNVNEIKNTMSPSELTFTGDITIPITSFLHIVTPDESTPRGTWPIFRLMDENGKIRNAAHDGSKEMHGSAGHGIVHAAESNPVSLPDDDFQALRMMLHQEYPNFFFEENPLLQPPPREYPDTGSTNTLLRAYTQMIRLREMDVILQNAQRQGRISFYMTCRGEEAIHIGAAAALSSNDTVLAQYREAGVLMWRGFTLQQFTDQCFSNENDLGKGRQMPIHYGSRALNYQTISSPLGTQLPQAVGVAYRSKIQGKRNVSIAFFGEGCASTTDFHSACNFAATLQVPVIFFCRNNGYAISTSVSEQYAGDGIISRCKGYGMAGLRVDGNDLFAVSAAVHAAKKYALETSAPVLIEAMTYRQGHHSTSDDSSRYRDLNEVQDFASHNDPVSRIGRFLQNVDVIGPDDSTQMEDAEKLAVLDAMVKAEQKARPPLESLFQDVYKEIPKHLAQQETKLYTHLSKNNIEY